MMKFIACLLLASAAVAIPPAAGQQPTSKARPVAVPAFVPASFQPPKLVETPRFTLVPLGPALVDRDYAAYMSSIEHLQTTFSRSTNWPRQDITRADSVKDMEGEQARFTSRRSFDYAVLSPDGSRELGSVYVSPSPVPGYDAMVGMWVTKDRYDAGFDVELYRWVRSWIQTAWPFRTVAYPERAIDWQSWDRLKAASKP